MTQRVLVLGADGFIGGHLVGSLVRSNWATPVAAGRRPPAGDGAVPRIRLDATDPAQVGRALQDVDAIVNCVAGSTAAIVAGARALFDCAGRMSPAPSIVHLSSMAVYRQTDGEVDESAPLGGSPGSYAEAKIVAEGAAAAFGRAVVLRPGIVYGPGSTLWSVLVGRLLLQRRLGDLGAAGSGICNLVHVDDVVAAVLAALRTPRAQGATLNLAAPNAPTWNGYFAAYAAALGALPLRRIGAGRLAVEQYVLGPALKLAELMQRRLPAPSRGYRRPLRPAIRPWLLDQCRQRLRLRAQAAQELLGLDWTDPSTGLQATAAWLLAGAPPILAPR